MQFKIGDKVQQKHFITDDQSKLSGIICGVGHVDNVPMYIVKLNHGFYLKDEHNHGYMSVIVVHPDNLQYNE